MSDVHRPFLTRSTRRLGALVAGLAVLAVAAVVGLIVQLGGNGSTDHAAAATHAAGSAAAVPAADASSEAPTPATSTSPSSRPTPTATAPTSAPAATPTRTAMPTHAASPPAAGRGAKPLTYVVQPGDNLTVIAAWFHLHGYGDLYDRNRAAIGADPNLIHPGLRITVSSAGISTKG